jgi:hypothetical protein
MKKKSISYNIEELKQFSIIGYLQSRGIDIEQNGKKHFCSSPFAKDTNWSFCIYPNNTFYCWSTGKSGDIIDLVQCLDGCSFQEAAASLVKGGFGLYTPNYETFKGNDDFWKNFDINKYKTKDNDETAKIILYGASRSIHNGYDCGVYFTRDHISSEWIRNPAMMFTHVDKNLNICGAKFRNINGNSNPRFTTRGRLGFYILDTNFPETWEKKRTWLCESETSSNSLWEYFIQRQRPARIISMGGVSSAPKELPKGMENNNLHLIIDYDGSEELYNERLKKYEHLNVTPIKLILPKGEDINSLYHRGEMWQIENLLL